MSIRFAAAVMGAAGAVLVDMVSSPATQGSSATATLSAKLPPSVPTRHLVWVYDLTGTKVDVIA